MLLKLGCKDPQVVAVQNLIKELGFVVRDDQCASEMLEVDGIFGPKTEHIVMDFQKSHGLLVDGVVGPITMKALQDDYVRRVKELNAPTALAATPTPDRIPLVRVAADKYLDGYAGLFLRADAATAYTTVREQVIALGGILTSSGGIRELSQGGGANRSLASFHYLGLALDLNVNSGMRNPENDPYVITLEDNPEGERPYLRVWARGLAEKGVQESTLDRVVTYRQRHGALPSCKGNFFDLTDLFLKAGFARVRPRPNFWSTTSELAAEWWHFQFEKPLIPSASTFGGELLRIYNRTQLEGTLPWSQRDRIFKLDWF